MSAARRRERLRRTWPQRLLITFNISLIVACLVVAGGLGYLNYKFAQLPRVSLGHVLADEQDSGGPQNFLLVGTDSSERLDPDDPVTIGRNNLGLLTDTIMILRVDPGSEQAQLLSLPRDLYVDLATGGSQRINTAISVGGVEALIETIGLNFDIPIHHYVEVDFFAFEELVEAIGGVPVYFPTPVRDERSGLAAPIGGCVTLDGEQALAYVRSRNYEVFEDGSWRTDPTGDLGRVSRQQDFMQRALERAVARGVRNPVTLNRLIDVGISTVTVDDDLGADDIFQLGNRFRTFNPDTLQKYSLPVSDDTVNGAQVLRLREAEAEPILDLFRGIAADDLSPAGVLVEVQNGSGVSGQAGLVADDLGGVGFNIAGTGDAETFDHARTLVRYAADQAAAADLVARYLAAGAELELVDDIGGADVIVVVGTDYAGALAEPAGVADVPPPPEGADDQLAPETTSTTIIGEVPQPSPETPCG